MKALLHVTCKTVSSIKKLIFAVLTCDLIVLKTMFKLVSFFFFFFTLIPVITSISATAADKTTVLMH
jgi:hypothetical protein